MNNYIIVYPNELTHYGVRGMKWGVRKDYRANSIGSTAIKNFKSNMRLLTDPNWKNNTIPLKEQKIFGGKGRTVGQLKAEANYKDSKKQQLNDAQKSQIRRERAKKAAVIGGSIVAAGLVAYGTYKYKKLTGEMHEMNRSIKMGQSMVNSLYKSEVGTGRNPILKSSVTYRGNDFKLHTAVKEATKDGSSYTNIAANTQRTFDNVRDYARAKKRYTGRY